MIDLLIKCQNNLPVELLKYICNFHHKKCKYCGNLNQFNICFSSFCIKHFWFFNKSPGFALPINLNNRKLIKKRRC